MGPGKASRETIRRTMANVDILYCALRRKRKRAMGSKRTGST
jgi:hypothetical protein